MQSVRRAFDVLFAVAQAEIPTTASTLATELDLPRPTVYRILDTLVARGVVTQGKSEKGYVLTPKLALLASGSRSTATLADVTLGAAVEREGGPLDLAPRASILAELAALLVLSVALQDRRGLTRDQYAQWHPGGALGTRARDG